MSVYPLFPAARPALAPILFPAIVRDGQIIVGSMDDLLFERMTANILADLAGNPIHAHLEAAWADRLNARIAQVAK